MNEALKQLNEIAKKIDIEYFYLIRVNKNKNDISVIIQGSYNSHITSSIIQHFPDVQISINGIGFTEIVVDKLKFVFT